MSHHIICVTIDTDPDGLSSYEINRQTLVFKGLEKAFDLPEKISDKFKSNIPFTWFVRIDGQLKISFGDSCHLYRKYEKYWDKLQANNHELGWHPHLYKLNEDGAFILITNPIEACGELKALWDDIFTNDLRFTSFRNGEGWHTNETMNFIEKLGISNDCTAIPGRSMQNHPMNWIGTPNQPFYPDFEDYKSKGLIKRKLIEIPINTWYSSAPYDGAPKIRYINPCIHEEIFENALVSFGDKIKKEALELHVWTLICHPDDMLPADKPDMLYALSQEVYINNVKRFCNRLTEIGHSFEFSTISKAGELWRKNFDK